MALCHETAGGTVRQLEAADMVPIRLKQLQNSLFALSRAHEAITVRRDEDEWTTTLANNAGTPMDIHVSLPLLRGIRSITNTAAEDLQNAGAPELVAHVVFDHNQAEVKRMTQRRRE